MNFKISYPALKKEDSNNKEIVSLMKLVFQMEKLQLDLKYPMLLIDKEKYSDFIITLPVEEQANLIFTIVNISGGLQVYFFVNGENKLSLYKLSSKNSKQMIIVILLLFLINLKVKLAQ